MGFAESMDLSPEILSAIDPAGQKTALKLIQVDQ